MKTTNFENSKKLAEIGFAGESETWKHDPDNFILGQKYWSYDLEVLLDALPDMLFGMVGKLTIHKNGIYFKDSEILVEKQKNESLADTAARLIVKLHEAGIINFNK